MNGQEKAKPRGNFFGRRSLEIEIDGERWVGNYHDVWSVERREDRGQEDRELAPRPFLLEPPYDDGS